MKKMFLAMMALVLGLSFGLATFAQAEQKKPTTAAEEKGKGKDEGKKPADEKKGEEKPKK
ncbi:MAG: hypothetical protein ACREI2_06385 [Nitrospiraceae bacterium]